MTASIKSKNGCVRNTNSILNSFTICVVLVITHPDIFTVKLTTAFGAEKINFAFGLQMVSSSLRTPASNEVRFTPEMRPSSMMSCWKCNDPINVLNPANQIPSKVSLYALHDQCSPNNWPMTRLCNIYSNLKYKMLWYSQMANLKTQIYRAR